MEPWEIEEQAMNYWRLCEELTIFQAALLTLSIDPSGSEAYCEDKQIHIRPFGYEPAKIAIGNALRKGLVKGTLVPRYKHVDEDTLEPIEGSVDILLSSVEVESLRSWLASRGFNAGFFFPDIADKPDYLDPQNPRYAPKLAAAVRAWQAVTDPGKKSPKQALEKWLRENAARFGLVDDDGNPINQAVDDCSKVANWNQSGGAPKTPS